MRDIHCPKDIGFTNTFEGKDCEMEQRYNNCYHCWTSAIARNNQEYLQRKLQEKEETDKLKALKEEVKVLKNPNAYENTRILKQLIEKQNNLSYYYALERRIEREAEE